MEQKQSPDFFEVVVNRKMYSGKKNLRFYLSNLFENIELAQKEVLDVGGGRGLLTFYVATRGAKRAVCLEPERDGSSKGMIKAYQDLRMQLSETLPVEMYPLTLQEYLQQTASHMFDVVIMHNSINHLDEEACIHLLEQEDAYHRYLSVFKNLYRITRKNGVLIVTDVSRHNLFSDIGVKNIFVPTIEWHKHHKPLTWISMLEKAGFKDAAVKWLSPNRLRGPGKLLMGNYLMSYLTRSYFRLTMRK
jgi:2-polyprenyl-3-methyl-5-hydroxy-6-metoxy-1,4-benzoquinol methylase